MNHCAFIGRLTRDPEIRSTSSGVSVVTFGVAINRKYKNASGEQHDDTTFIDCEAWDTGADTIAKWFKKGDPIVIADASARNSNWTTNDGQKRSKMVFRVNRFEFPPSNKKSPNGGGDGERGGNEAPAADVDNDIPF